MAASASSLDEAGAPITDAAFGPLVYPSTHVLDMRGPRGGLTAARAQEYVAGVLTRGEKHIQRMILSTWAFSEEAAEVVARAMAQLPQLESVILADIIAGRPEAVGLAVYRALGKALQHAQLIEIDLSDNAVGPKGVEACRDFLSGQRQLQRLSFCNCGISAEAARSIADVLLFRLPTQLQLLHFDNNMSGNGGAIAIADIVRASPALRDFRFSSSRGGREGGVALIQALQYAPLLQRLNLSDNTFGVPGGEALRSLLRSSRHLVELNVSDISLGDAGIAAVVSGLVRGARGTLTTLDVAQNDITAAGAAAIARCVRRCTALQVLDASDNEIGTAGAVTLARALGARTPASTDSLAEISLRNCDIGRVGAEALVRAVLAHAPQLGALRLQGNRVSAAAYAALVAELEAAGRQSVMADAPGEEEDDDAEEDDDEDDVEETGPEVADSDLEDGAASKLVEASEGDAVLAALRSAAGEDASVQTLADAVETIKL